MAYIAIYDATPLDQRQLSAALARSDHHWEYSEDSITLENIHPEAEVISIFVSSTVTREIIDAMPKLKLISCRSTGFNNVDMKAATERGITVTNVPTYGEHTVAEYAFALLLTLTRKVPQAVKSSWGNTDDQVGLMGVDLVGKTIGIVGMGRIGQQAARIASGFGMEILAYDPFPNEDRATELNFSYVNLQELAKRSDVISIHSPYTGENRHLIDEAFLSLVKPSVILLNTARGELIDTGALIEALQQKKLAAVGLDVLEGEKLLDIDEEMMLLRRKNVSAEALAEVVEADVLSRFPNVIITPHNAFNTIEAVGRINQTAADNIINYWYGEMPNKVAVPVRAVSGKLIIVRHGESEWNALGKWTGSTDVHLSEKGFRQAAQLGQAIIDIKIDQAFVSQQIRAFETFAGIVDAAGQFDVPFERSDALNERDYGDYTGLNKWEVKDKLGEEVFNHLRRDWDYPVPNGETLKMVYARAVPYFQEKILPELLAGKNVLIVSHGNAIRALVKYLENLPDSEVANIEMLFGTILLYEIDANGRSTKKDSRAIETEPTPA